MKKLPSVSIMIPTFNRKAVLVEALLSLNNIDYPKNLFEVVVVNDGSSDNTTTMIELLARKNKNIKGIIFYKRFGHQPALKAGIENKNLRNSLKNIDKICKDFDFDPLRIFVIKLFVSYTISIKVFKEIVFQ